MPHESLRHLGACLIVHRKRPSGIEAMVVLDDGKFETAAGLNKQDHPNDLGNNEIIPQMSDEPGMLIWRKRRKAWSFIGGGKEKGETCPKTLGREVFEELATEWRQEEISEMLASENAGGKQLSPFLVAQMTKEQMNILAVTSFGYPYDSLSQPFQRYLESKVASSLVKFVTLEYLVGLFMSCGRDAETGSLRDYRPHTLTAAYLWYIHQESEDLAREQALQLSQCAYGDVLTVAEHKQLKISNGAFTNSGELLKPSDFSPEDRKFLGLL